jgi:site-specific recombinase XerD
MENTDKTCCKKNVTLYSTEFSYEFLKSKFGDLTRFPINYTQAEYLRAINKLDEYYKYGLISSKRPISKKYIFPNGFDEHIREYIEKRKSQGLSSKRMQILMLYLERFSLFLDDNDVKSFKFMSNHHINQYIEYVSKYTASTVKASICCLRMFFSYLQNNGVTDKDYSVILPQVRHDREEAIPSAFSKNEVETILNCIDRGYPTGKRNYAMLLIAARLGLRASDICGLALSDISWDENKISIVQQKTSKLLILPLLNEVGDAIIEYLKVRPCSESTEIFLRADPPFVRLTSASLYEITNKYVHRSGVHLPQGKKHGSHSLRHSLSSILLESSVSLPIISDILSHNSSDTTKIYLKVSIMQLRECALEVQMYNQKGCDSDD